MLMDQKHLMYERGTLLLGEHMNNSLQVTLLWMEKIKFNNDALEYGDVNKFIDPTAPDVAWND